jgi:RNA polymerase-binding transcription factor DksA
MGRLLFTRIHGMRVHNHAVIHGRGTVNMTTTQLKEIRAELTRQGLRLEPNDPQAHAVAAALRRLDEGTYGYCVRCSNKIPHGRLAVMPETVFCVGCRRGN